MGADASRAARCVCSAAPCVCFHGGVGGGTARRAATQQQHTRIMPMAAPTAMVASQRPMTAPSVGPPPLNGVHSPPAPLKCPAVQRAPSGRNGEASTSCSWPLSKPQAQLQQPSAACFPTRERRASQSCGRVQRSRSVPLVTPVLTRAPVLGLVYAAACRPLFNPARSTEQPLVPLSACAVQAAQARRAGGGRSTTSAVESGSRLARPHTRLRG